MFPERNALIIKSWWVIQQKTNHIMHHMIPLWIRNKSNNAINSTARVPILESVSLNLLQHLKQLTSENINISLKQKKANITTINVILIIISAYMTSKEVEMKTATESMQSKQLQS